MKRCPACNQTYADDALSFCPNDGTSLVGASGPTYNPQATIMSSPPPGVTQQPPSLFDDPGSSDWNAPPYSPPQDLNTPGAWMPPPSPGAWQQPLSPQGMPGMTQTGNKPQQALAAASLICGIISVTLGLICGGPILAIAAIVLGVIALAQIKKDPQRYSGKAMAIIGIIMGALWIIFGILFLIIVVLGNLAR